MRLGQLGNGATGAVQQGGVVQRMGGQQGFKIRRRAGIEMHAGLINQQAQRRFSVAAGMDRAQQGVLDPEQRCAGFFGHRLATVGIGDAAPDGDQIVGFGFAKAQVIARQLQDAADAALAQKPAVVIEKPPGFAGPAGSRVVLSGITGPDQRLSMPALETDPTEPSVPVRAEITLLHWVKGASVT